MAFGLGIISQPMEKDKKETIKINPISFPKVMLNQLELGGPGRNESRNVQRAISLYQVSMSNESVTTYHYSVCVVGLGKDHNQTITTGLKEQVQEY